MTKKKKKGVTRKRERKRKRELPLVYLAKIISIKEKFLKKLKIKRKKN